MEEGLFSIRVTPLGPNLCLLEDLIEGEVEVLVEERKSWWEQWFFNIKPWDPLDIDDERYAWIRIFGVHCHVWGEWFFSTIADSLGHYVRSTEESLVKQRMDEARVCIRIKSMDKVDVSLKFNIEGVLFPIRILEENYLIINKKKAPTPLEDESGSDSYF